MLLQTHRKLPRQSPLLLLLRFLNLLNLPLMLIHLMHQSFSPLINLFLQISLSVIKLIISSISCRFIKLTVGMLLKLLHQLVLSSQFDFIKCTASVIYEAYVGDISLHILLAWGTANGLGFAVSKFPHFVSDPLDGFLEFFGIVLVT